ncbi:MAG: hypothetical protein QXD64_07100 [Thermoplasmata archaeon]
MVKKRRHIKIATILVVVSVCIMILILPLTVFSKDSSRMATAQETYRIIERHIKEQWGENTFYLITIFADSTIDGRASEWEAWFLIGESNFFSYRVSLSTNKVTAEEFSFILSYNITEIQIKKWKIDSDEAYKIARENATLRSKGIESSGDYEISMQLFVKEYLIEERNESQLRWVWYIGWEGAPYFMNEGSNWAHVFIDAENGKINNLEVSIEKPSYFWYTPNPQNPWFMCCIGTLTIFIVGTVVLLKTGMIRKWIENWRREKEEECRREYERRKVEWEDRKL